MTGADFLAWRERTGLTQEKAAARLGVTRTTIQNWESGQTGVPPVIATGCQVWERRLKQETPALGPVTLIYTSSPMYVNPYGPRGPVPAMRQESLPNNAAALGRVLALWGGRGFHSPLVLDETEDILWNALELRRVVEGLDPDAPTPRRWRSRAIADVAEHLRKTAQKSPPREGGRTSSPAEAETWARKCRHLLDQLDRFAAEAEAGDVDYRYVDAVVGYLRTLGLVAPGALVSALAQAFAP